MGKKRRVLRSPKFARLRKHPKYVGLVAANKQETGEVQEVVEEVIKPAEEIPTFVLETVAEPVVVEAPKAPELVKAVKTKSKPRAKAKAKKKTFSDLSRSKKKVLPEDKS